MSFAIVGSPVANRLMCRGKENRGDLLEHRAGQEIVNHVEDARRHV